MQVLDWISIKGFKSIAALEKLPLGRVNVVIGANGAGKSNFIEVFSFLHALKAGHLQAHVARAGGADRLLRFGAKQTPEMSIHVSFEEGRNQYAIELAATDVDGLAPVSGLLGDCCGFSHRRHLRVTKMSDEESTDV